MQERWLQAGAPGSERKREGQDEIDANRGLLLDHLI